MQLLSTADPAPPDLPFPFDLNMDEQQSQNDPNVLRSDQSKIDKLRDHVESTRQPWSDILSSQMPITGELGRDAQHQDPSTDDDGIADNSRVGRPHPVQSDDKSHHRDDRQPQGHFPGSDAVLPTSGVFESIRESTLAAAASHTLEADQVYNKSQVIPLWPFQASAEEPTTNTQEPQLSVSTGRNEAEQNASSFTTEDKGWLSAAKGREEWDATQHQPDSQSLPNLGPESTLCAPLTHPNGVSIFPGVSMPEQEEMSYEALIQAENAIVA